ncbi:hypothetical protein SAMD00019534_079820 [Acytostelium subglobosum LB1]|uniref:hypothetical protein n=1 Tax=Acytostelium subglobosum LB1 TaxID=1410327 RepID=UPI0006451A43|nr:hypothetical protein SAMD00019534_079820 [Acytostelium subglobosum LB1]GAM24807.1 hypothetical protein SAMD00019534_079820 [Acytostelium subglobosum LB1]|eukprot:XP_012752476.1 hypothetical protein SAMD00019534_079820 [Acytostelium subglobosum LB1]
MLEVDVRGLAYHGYLDKLRQLLTDPVHLNKIMRDESMASTRLQDELVAEIATMRNHLHIVRYLHQHPMNDLIFNGYELQTSARHGHIEMSRFLYENRPASRSDKILMTSFKNAIKCGHLEIVSTIHGWQLANKTAEEASSNKDQLRIKKVWRMLTLGKKSKNKKKASPSSGVEVDDCMDIAARYGRLDIVKWLHENRSDTGCTTSAMDWAAYCGHLEIVKFLHENRTEGGTEKCWLEAAENGHLEVIKFLHHNRTEPCTPEVMEHAAMQGRMAVVQWLHYNRTEGCTNKAIDHAAMSGHLNVIKWLFDNRTEGCSYMALDNAAAFGHKDIVVYLHEVISAPCSKQAMTNAAMIGKLDIVEYLHDNRTEGCHRAAMTSAAFNGYFEVVKFLHHNRTECSNKEDAIRAAQSSGHKDIAYYLQISTKN